MTFPSQSTHDQLRVRLGREDVLQVLERKVDAFLAAEREALVQGEWEVCVLSDVLLAEDYVAQNERHDVGTARRCFARSLLWPRDT